MFRGRAAVVALARRFEAAWVSVERGISQDWALKRHVKKPKAHWVAMAERLINKQVEYEESLSP